MKENIKESLMIILKGYKDNSLREEDVLTLIETIMDNYATKFKTDSRTSGLFGQHLS